MIHTTTEVTALPPSFLIGMKNSFFDTTLDTTKMKLESGNEPQPSKVLYIGPSKRLNDYYAPMA
jgi:hypothetical protein